MDNSNRIYYKLHKQVYKAFKTAYLKYSKKILNHIKNQ